MRHTAVSPNWGPPTDDQWFWFGGSLRLGKFRTPPVTSEPIAVLFHNVIVIVIVIVKDVFCKASRSTKEARATWIKGVYIWMSIVVLICFNYIMGLIMEHGKLTRTNIAACNDGGILMERKRHWMTTDDSLMTPHEIVIQCVNPWSKIVSVRKGWQRDIHNCWPAADSAERDHPGGNLPQHESKYGHPTDKDLWQAILGLMSCGKTQHNAHRNLVAAYVYTSYIWYLGKL